MTSKRKKNSPEVVYDLPLNLLAGVNPMVHPPWNGMSYDYSSITADEIHAATEVPEPLKGESSLETSQLNTRTHHCGRIRWLAIHGWKDPIKIDMTSCIWPVVDGNHRLAAAFFLGHASIKATLQGESDEQVTRFLNGEYKLGGM